MATSVPMSSPAVAFGATSPWRGRIGRELCLRRPVILDLVGDPEPKAVTVVAPDPGSSPG